MADKESFLQNLFFVISLKILIVADFMLGNRRRVDKNAWKYILNFLDQNTTGGPEKGDAMKSHGQNGYKLYINS